jgi:Ca2+-binding RTX toxin-like protein
MNPRCRSLLGAAVALAVLAAAPAARAATTEASVIDDGGSLDGSLAGKRTLAVRSASLISPVNDLRISLSSGVLTVADVAGNGPRVSAGSGCDRIGGAAERVTCAAAGIEGLFVSSGPGDDQVTDSTSLPSVVDGDAGDDRLIGGAASDALRGGDGSDTLLGREGVDALEGGHGPDRLHGNQSGDVLHGDDGDDVLVGDETTEPGGNDVLDGASGNDTLTGAVGDDRLRGGPGADQLSGGSGVDTVDYSDHVTPVTVVLDAHVGDGGNDDGPGEFVSQDVENVVGTSFDDLITGSATANRLDGGAGRDLLDGAGGDDLLRGGAGPDVLAGGPGIVTVSYADHAEPLEVMLDDVANDGGTSDGQPFARDDVRPDVENVTGGAAADTLTGDAAHNTLDGGPGADGIEGRGGDDVLLGGDGQDFLFGDPGRDTLDGGADNDQLVAAGDGETDDVACGKGSDRALLDLVDEPVGNALLAQPVDCETIFRAAVGEHPTVVIAARATLAGRRIAVRLTCPRAVPGAGCRGHLAIRRARETLARGAYALAPGARRTLRLRLAAAPRRRTALRAIATERDREGRRKLTVQRLRQ